MPSAIGPLLRIAFHASLPGTLRSLRHVAQRVPPASIEPPPPRPRRPPQVNYFPSRFDPSRHAERFPIPSRPLAGRRERGEPLG